jgi:hypothetical protein
MSDEQQQQGGKSYRTEWSFSFDKLGEQIGDFVRSVSAQTDEEIKHGVYSDPLGEAASAIVRLDLAVGEHTLYALPADSPNLIEADLNYIGEIKFATSGETERYVALSQTVNAGSWVRGVVGLIGSRKRLTWRIGLSPNLPIALDVRGGVGEAILNLSDLHTSRLSLAMGTGEMTVHLPAKGGYPTRISAGIGEFTIHVPADSPLDMTVDGGTGETTLHMAPGVHGVLAVKGGVGETTLHITPGTAIRVEAHIGVGSVDVHGHSMNRVRGGDAFISTEGVWETPGYETADRKLAIRFDGGVGALKIR